MQVLKDEVRHKILVEAQHLFLQSGYEHTTLQMIAERVGVSKGNLYRYFQSKQDIFYELTDSAAKGLRELVLRLRDDRLGAADYQELLLEQATLLLLHEKYGFLLIMEQSRGTRYEGLFDGLTKVFAGRIAASIRDDGNRELMARVMANNLLSGLVQVAKARVRPGEVREGIALLLAYHNGGIQSISTT